MSTNEKNLIFRPKAGVTGLELMHFEGEERLSSLFNFSLLLRAGLNGRINAGVAEALRGSEVTFGVRSGGGDRLFHGIVLETNHDELAGQLRLTVGPAFWYLQALVRHRVFTGKTVPDIVEAVLAEHGRCSYRMHLQGDHRPHKIRVQYRESDGNFLMRLLEEEGIFFWFEHKADDHILHLGDHSPALAAGPVREIPLRRQGPPGDDSSGERIDGWLLRQSPRTGGVAFAGYHSPARAANLHVLNRTSGVKPKEQAAIVHEGLAPVGSASRSEVEQIARRRMLARQAEEAGIEATGDVCLHPGDVFRRTGESEPFLVKTVVHSAGERTLTGPAEYRCHFFCQPARVPFLPQRLTPKPVVGGWHPAVVVGPGGAPVGQGSDLHLDPNGQVRIRFRWDTLSSPHNALVWVPVVRHGTDSLNLPRIGQEVAVIFEEGDPDRPLIIGLAPAEKDKLPHDPEQHPDRVSLRLPADPESGDAEATIFWADTKLGRQKVFHHIPRNLEQRVQRNQHSVVGGEARLSIGKDLSLTVSGSMLQKIGESLGLSIAGQGVIAAEELVFKATSKITIQCGASSLVLSPDGISITGPLVLLNSAGGPAPTQAVPAQPKLPEIAEDNHA